MRRTISVVLLLGYVASQLAAVPHAHRGDPLHSGHASIPHVHLSWFSDEHCDHDPHHHDHGFAEHAKSGVTDCSLTTGWVSPEHDADAIYLAPSAVAARPPHELHANSLNAWHPLMPYMACRLFEEAAFKVASAAEFERSPNGSVWHCARYLQLGTLRI